MLQSGQLLGSRYLIQNRIGGGGMGTVYLADDGRLKGRRCAIKEMSPEALAPGDREWSIEAFRQEAQLLAMLQHPGLTAVTDFFGEGGNWYLVMDYVEGETLEKRLARRPDGRLPVEEALEVARQVLDVLTYLHEHPSKIVFRDLKPSNVMCTPEGQVKLIDFGIARFFKPGKAHDTALMGTPGFAAPEQYGGMGQTDARTDLYSVGVLLHHMITGFDPFRAVTPFPVPDPRATMPTIPTYIAAVIQRATQLRPELRYASAAEMQRDLRLPAARGSRPTPTATAVMFEPYEPQQAAQSSRPTPRKRGGLWVGMGAVALLLFLCIGLTAVAFSQGLILLPGRESARTAVVTPGGAGKPTASPSGASTASPTATESIVVASPSPSPEATETLEPEPTDTVSPLTFERVGFGRSVNGRELQATVLGYRDGIPVVVVGSIQGDQAQTQVLVGELIDHYRQDVASVPAGRVYYFIPSLNPDGNAAGSRYNANGVDLNRNWGTADWRSNAAVPGYPEGKSGAGGSSPFSEPETTALRDLLFELRSASPNLRVMILHASVNRDRGEVYPGGNDAMGLATAYADAAGYGVEQSWDQYTTSGEAVTWCSENGITAIDVVIAASAQATTGAPLLNATLRGLVAISR